MNSRLVSLDAGGGQAVPPIMIIGLGCPLPVLANRPFRQFRHVVCYLFIYRAVFALELADFTVVGI